MPLKYATSVDAAHPLLAVALTLWHIALFARDRLF